MTPLLIIVGIFVVVAIIGVAWRLHQIKKHPTPPLTPKIITLVTGLREPAFAYLSIKGLPTAHYVKDVDGLLAYRGPGVELHMVGPTRAVDSAMCRSANSRGIRIRIVAEPGPLEPSRPPLGRE